MLKNCDNPNARAKLAFVRMPVSWPVRAHSINRGRDIEGG